MGESSKRERSPLLTEVPDSGPNPEDIYSRQERQRILLSLMASKGRASGQRSESATLMSGRYARRLVSWASRELRRNLD